MIWLAIGSAYLAVGLLIVGWMLGASKHHNRWSPSQAWDQLTLEGVSGMGFWLMLAVGWFPIIVYVLGRNILVGPR